VSVAGRAGPVIGYPVVRDALRASHLHDLPSEVLDELLDGAVRIKVPAGSIAHRALAEDHYLELVITGVIRVFVTAPDGRTMTIRYCRSGELLGAMSLFSDEFAEPATKQALVDTQLLMISPAKVRALAQRDPRVAGALLVELSERARTFVNEIPGTAFATVRQRVARQLLDLASTHHNDSDPSDELAVRITQQDLAAAVGTVREVVVRALRQLRDAGAVRTERDRIVLLDPAHLTEEVKWNTSR
jgi:CRP/FNR family transcriptional regulator, cyclic AMP receptor protein